MKNFFKNLYTDMSKYVSWRGVILLFILTNILVPLLISEYTFFKFLIVQLLIIVSTFSVYLQKKSGA